LLVADLDNSALGELSPFGRQELDQGYEENDLGQFFSF